MHEKKPQFDAHPSDATRDDTNFIAKLAETDPKTPEGYTDDSSVAGRTDDDGIREGTAMPRPPYFCPDFSDETMLIACDSGTYPLSEVTPPDNALGVHVGAMLGRAPSVSAEEYKMGAAIADRAGIGIPPRCLERILRLKEADPAMKRAVEAALCAVLATTVAPVDIATILYAIGSFIHAHPDYSSVVEDATWQHPYGERTTYEAMRIATEDLPDGRDIEEDKSRARSDDGEDAQ